jgi:hypothetical protein
MTCNYNVIPKKVKHGWLHMCINYRIKDSFSTQVCNYDTTNWFCNMTIYLLIHHICKGIYSYTIVVIPRDSCIIVAYELFFEF